MLICQVPVCELNCQDGIVNGKQAPLIKPSIAVPHSELITLAALRVQKAFIPPPKIRWVSWDPSENLTLNVDGSVDALGPSGEGIIREINGRPKLLFMVRFDSGLSNTKAEFMAALRGLRGASLAGLAISEVHTDSSVLADAVNNSNSRSWDCYYLVRCIRKELRGAKLRHIYREANQVAYALAKDAHTCGSLVSSSLSVFNSHIKALVALDHKRTPSCRLG
uniref:RNase H type-1 domain-containing protein n=1 Tax=Kalanchoe fedtschenkoi TaxID=63787 RepID=A0A7N0SZ11_KALFE